MVRNSLSCPRCGCRHTYVTNTYTHEIIWQGRQKTVIRRRRLCRHCGRAFFTVEDSLELYRSIKQPDSPGEQTR